MDKIDEEFKKSLEAYAESRPEKERRTFHLSPPHVLQNITLADVESINIFPNTLEVLWPGKEERDPPCVHIEIEVVVKTLEAAKKVKVYGE